MPKWIFGLSFLLLTEANSQSVSTILGARAAALGNATSSQMDEWAIFCNPAGIGSLKHSIVASTIDVRPSLLGSIRMATLFTQPLPFGTTGLSFFRFGDNLYNEQIISAAFANKIGITSLGAKLSYIQYRAEGFGTHAAIGLNVGGITQITPTLSIGAWAQNINLPKLKFDEQEKAPVKLLASITFRPTEKFTVSTELEKDILYRPLWKTGMEYIIHKKFFARAGFNIHPDAYFLGVGFYGTRLTIDYALQSITQFAASHQASFSYMIKEVSRESK